MRFSQEYSVLKEKIFTTIRKNTGFYRIGQIYGVETPDRKFKAEVIASKPIVKAEIDENLAQNDADMSAEELIALLEAWYGKKFDDFVLLTLKKRNL